MSFARVFSAQTTLLDAHIVMVEIDLSQGMHAFSIVGLPDKAIEESRDRVSAAIKNSVFPKDKDFKAPKHNNKKITVSLAPAELKKEGPLFDVPIAIAYLIATNELSKAHSDTKLFFGELALDGTVRPTHGVLAFVQKAQEEGFSEVFVPEKNAEEASMVTGITVYPMKSLTEVVAHLRGSASIEPYVHKRRTSTHKQENLLESIKGQDHAKQGLIIAAAGGHNIALFGPPGTGKTMLARSLCSLLPPLSYDTSMEVTRIHSIAGTLHNPIITQPPLRSPHHTASYVSLVGGGTVPHPGEVTLAHRGVLFLDEFPEFDRRVINALRQPLEDGVVSITRAKGSALFPSNFILIAAMNPCACGYYGTNKCICTASQLQRYQQRLSGPIMDRIDMWIEVGAVQYSELLKKSENTHESDEARTRVAAARAIQHARFKNTERLNSGMSPKGLAHHATLSPTCISMLNKAAKSMDLSPRAYHRVIKLARTIADLQNVADITPDHLFEALAYRPKQER